MILIDGRQTDMHVGSFANLEEILVKVMNEELIENHIITDVVVNDEAFTEIYPHQAEDISAEDISRVEVRTISMEEMAADVTQELFTVGKIMQNGTKRVAELFRQGDTAESLELLQDLCDVTRNFLGTLHVLHSRFPAHDFAGLEAIAVKLQDMLTEMDGVMQDQDWLLLADLLEYEFAPACEEWNGVLANLSRDIAASRAE